MKQFAPEITKAFVLTSFCALTTLAAAPAQAVILTFENLAVNNNSNVLNNVGTSYTDQNFTVSQVGSQSQPFAVWSTQSSRYPGSTALVNGTGGGSIRLTQVGDLPFTLSSIDLANIFNDATSTPVTFTGLTANNTNVSQTFTTSAPGLTTFNFNSSFTNLVSVDWVQATPFHQFDNINVSAASTAVPEPFTVLGTIFGVGSGVALKRKLAKVQADK